MSAAKRRAPEVARKPHNEARRDEGDDETDRLSRDRLGREGRGREEEEKEKIMKLVEEQGEVANIHYLFDCKRCTVATHILSYQGEAVDASAVRRMILSFEKKSLKNQEMRTKFPDNPERHVVVAAQCSRCLY